MPEKQAALIEILLVFLVLSLIAGLGNNTVADWTAALAVFLGFLHTQRSFDLDEPKHKSHQQCSSAYSIQTLHIAKESMWILTFAVLQSYPLLTGAILFISYPVWRKYLRAEASEGAEIEFERQLILNESQDHLRARSSLMGNRDGQNLEYLA